MELLAGYAPQLMITSGIAILAFEVMVLGFATFILFFLGVSLVMTGALVWLGVLPNSWTVLLLSNAALTAILAAALWKPMLKMQNQTDVKAVKSDFDGVRFVVSGVVDKFGATRHLYSGVSWQLKSQEEIPAGSEVEVVTADVGVLWVKAVD